MERLRRANSPQWDALVCALFALVASAVFVGWRLATPSDCVWLPPQQGAFSAAGVIPLAQDGCPVTGGTLVSDATRDAGNVLYVTEPGSRVVVTTLTRDPGALGLRLWHAGGTLLFVSSLFGLCGYSLSRRPRDPAAGSSLVYSSALLGSTMVTVVGLPPASAFAGPLRWLFALNVGFVYTLAWGAMLAWSTQFPGPLTPWLAGARVRALFTWTPPVAWALVAVLAGAGRPFHAWMARAIPLQTGFTVVCLAGTLLVLGLRLVRLRHPGGDLIERQQLLWLGGSAIVSALLALALWIVPSLVTGRALLPEDQIGMPGLLFVGGMGIAMLRYRLFDLDVVLARTLVYAALTLAAVVVYLATVGLLTGFVTYRADGVAVAGAVAVAIAVNPARVLLHRLVNRALYGDRDDPYRALSRLAGLLTAREVAWGAVADDLRRAMRVPFVAIRSDAETVIESGTPPSEEGRLLTEPLVHAGVNLGHLVVATRGRGDRFAPPERRLLADLATQVATAVHEEGLDREVQASRTRLALAREEERRLLRRALHDDVGPTMAAVSLRASTARHLLSRPSAQEEVARVLDRIEREATGAADAIRLLAYDLRPPALDDRGLAEALRERIGDLPDLRVHLRTGGLVPPAAPIPAAVEAAAYRIVIGALDNAARHADADQCWVEVTGTAGGLEVRIEDDGVGAPEGYRAGVGITAMRERAKELGGTCTIEGRATGGTVVRAILPVGGRA